MTTPFAAPGQPAIDPAYAAAAAAYQGAQTPAQQAAAASALPGATDLASAMASQGAAPVAAPSFEELLGQAQQRNSALEQQINQLQANFQSQLAQLQGQFAGIVAAMPAKVDPVTESATKLVTALKAVPASDARNVLTSVVNAHLTNLGLTDLAKTL